jgi:hypothetical protein
MASCKTRTSKAAYESCMKDGQQAKPSSSERPAPPPGKAPSPPAAPSIVNSDAASFWAKYAEASRKKEAEKKEEAARVQKPSPGSPAREERKEPATVMSEDEVRAALYGRPADNGRTNNGAVATTSGTNNVNNARASDTRPAVAAGSASRTRDGVTSTSTTALRGAPTGAEKKPENKKKSSSRARPEPPKSYAVVKRTAASDKNAPPMCEMQDASAPVCYEGRKTFKSECYAKLVVGEKKFDASKIAEGACEVFDLSDENVMKQYGGGLQLFANPEKKPASVASDTSSASSDSTLVPASGGTKASNIAVSKPKKAEASAKKQVMLHMGVFFPGMGDTQAVVDARTEVEEAIPEALQSMLDHRTKAAVVLIQKVNAKMPDKCNAHELVDHVWERQHMREKPPQFRKLQNSGTLVPEFSSANGTSLDVFVKVAGGGGEKLCYQLFPKQKEYDSAISIKKMCRNEKECERLSKSWEQADKKESRCEKDATKDEWAEWKKLSHEEQEVEVKAIEKARREKTEADFAVLWKENCWKFEVFRKKSPHEKTPTEEKGKVECENKATEDEWAKWKELSFDEQEAEINAVKRERKEKSAADFAVLWKENCWKFEAFPKKTPSEKKGKFECEKEPATKDEWIKWEELSFEEQEAEITYIKKEKEEKTEADFDVLWKENCWKFEAFEKRNANKGHHGHESDCESKGTAAERDQWKTLSHEEQKAEVDALIKLKTTDPHEFEIRWKRDCWIYYAVQKGKVDKDLDRRAGKDLKDSEDRKAEFSDYHKKIFNRYEDEMQKRTPTLDGRTAEFTNLLHNKNEKFSKRLLEVLAKKKPDMVGTRRLGLLHVFAARRRVAQMTQKITSATVPYVNCVGVDEANDFIKRLTVNPAKQIEKQVKEETSICTRMMFMQQGSAQNVNANYVCHKASGRIMERCMALMQGYRDEVDITGVLDACKSFVRPSTNTVGGPALAGASSSRPSGGSSTGSTRGGGSPSNGKKAAQIKRPEDPCKNGDFDLHCDTKTGRTYVSKECWLSNAYSKALKDGADVASLEASVDTRVQQGQCRLPRLRVYPPGQSKKKIPSADKNNKKIRNLIHSRMETKIPATVLNESPEEVAIAMKTSFQGMTGYDTEIVSMEILAEGSSPAKKLRFRRKLQEDDSLNVSFELAIIMDETTSAGTEQQVMSMLSSLESSDSAVVEDFGKAFGTHLKNKNLISDENAFANMQMAVWAEQKSLEDLNEEIEITNEEEEQLTSIVSETEDFEAAAEEVREFEEEQQEAAQETGETSETTAVEAAAETNEGISAWQRALIGCAMVVACVVLFAFFHRLCNAPQPQNPKFAKEAEQVMNKFSRKTKRKFSTDSTVSPADPEDISLHPESPQQRVVSGRPVEDAPDYVWGAVTTRRETRTNVKVPSMNNQASIVDKNAERSSAIPYNGAIPYNNRAIPYSVDPAAYNPHAAGNFQLRDAARRTATEQQASEASSSQRTKKHKRKTTSLGGQESRQSQRFRELPVEEANYGEKFGTQERGARAVSLNYGTQNQGAHRKGRSSERKSLNYVTNAGELGVYRVQYPPVSGARSTYPATMDA